MVQESITVVWCDNFSFTCNLRKRKEDKKLLNLLKSRGDPIQILGDGRYAELMRKEYKIYQLDPKDYPGIPYKEAMVASSSVLGIPIDKINKTFKRLKMK